jgi:adenylate cyclase class 2
MADIEIEIKVKVENSEPLLEFLEKSAEFQAEKHQIDEYFSPAHRDFLKLRPTAEWLRLRNTDGSYSITYKNYHFDKEGRSRYCDEYESKIEDLDRVKKIFDVLNFKSLVIVDKIRKVWIYKDYEIAIDTVKGLGGFIEIEYFKESEKVNPEKITKEMMGFLKGLKVGKIEREHAGYPFMLLFKNEVKYEVQ